MKKQFDAVVKWANDRNIINGSTPQVQLTKLIEEFGELASGVSRKDNKKIMDSIGDCTVVSIIMLQQLGFHDDPFEAIRWEPFFVEDASPHELVAYGLEKISSVAYNVYNKREIGKEKSPASIISFLDALCDIAFMYNTSLKDCLILAFSEIEFRRGVVLDGVFIKREDIPALLPELQAKYDEVNKQILDNVEKYGEHPSIDDIKNSEHDTETLQALALELANNIALLRREL